MNTVREFIKALMNDERGDMSYADKTVHLSSAAKVVIGAAAITAAAAGAATTSNNSNKTSDKTSKDIANANGTSGTDSTKNTTTPFAQQ